MEALMDSSGPYHMEVISPTPPPPQPLNLHKYSSSSSSSLALCLTPSHSSYLFLHLHINLFNFSPSCSNGTEEIGGTVPMKASMYFLCKWLCNALTGMYLHAKSCFDLIDRKTSWAHFLLSGSYQGLSFKCKGQGQQNSKYQTNRSACVCEVYEFPDISLYSFVLYINDVWNILLLTTPYKCHISGNYLCFYLCEL